MTAGEHDASVGRRVLLVDDEQVVLQAHARVLEAQGYKVERAARGDAALAALRRAEFDLIFSDIDMPDMNGTCFLEEVRRLDLDVSFVLITREPSVASATKAIECGALRYLIKPVEPDLLVRVADDAVRSHRLARAQREAFDLAGGMTRVADDHADLHARFQRALDSMWIAYQPIVSWSRRSVYAYEALLRTAEPSLPTPHHILEAGERLGRLDELGRAIRARAIEPLARLPRDISLFINLHPSDLFDEQLFGADSPLAPVAERIVLEITERASLHELGPVRARAQRLRCDGFRLAVDDLGAGYSGLSTFALLDPEVVKLDVSLVRDIHREPTKRKLALTMITMCRELGITITAEGIETAGERDALAAAGCDLMQGFLFARPGESFPHPRW